MKRSRNLRLTIAFDGTRYHGWQIQKNAPTIQGIVRDAVENITGERVNLIGSGRTDAGTHARRMVANFLTRSEMPVQSLARALNSLLPGDIRIVGAGVAPPGFHAQHSARSKIYRYQIYRGQVLPPHLAHEYYHYPLPLDVDVMAAAAEVFAGRHDFASLAAQSGRNVSRTTRRVYRSEINTKGHILWYTVEADGFLHHMVRNMIGTLLQAGRGTIRLAELKGLFKERNRNLAGFTAPARGLILLRVKY